MRDNRALTKLVVHANNGRVLGIHMNSLGVPEIVRSLDVALRAGSIKRNFDQTVAAGTTITEGVVIMRSPARTVP